jgi:addiction module RelB/DinJ family antitoxin
MLFRGRVPTARLRRAEKVFARLGIKPGDAFNIFLAQVELRNDLPFAITTHPERLLSTAEQGKVWEDALSGRRQARLAPKAFRSEYLRICQRRPTRPYPQTRQVERGTDLSR